MRFQKKRHACAFEDARNNWTEINPPRGEFLDVYYFSSIVLKNIQRNAFEVGGMEKFVCSLLNFGHRLTTLNLKFYKSLS